MTFRIHALAFEPFAPLFSMSDAALAAHGARRMTVDEQPGFPCRVSLRDAAPGETVLLVNHCSQPADTPYRATHAIFVRHGAVQADPAPGELPESLASRTLSLRAFDAAGMMRDARVVDGAGAAAVLEHLLGVPDVEAVHIHNAGPGCFAAVARRA